MKKRRNRVCLKKYWGNGLRSDAIKEIIKFGFESVQLNRIEGGCDTDNIGSEKVMLSDGLKYEGTLRKNKFIKGEFDDSKILSILKDEFLFKYTS